MKRHTVTLSDLNEYMEEVQITYASSTSSGGKKLRFDAIGNFFVWHKKEQILKTEQPKEAVELYNDLP